MSKFIEKYLKYLLLAILVYFPIFSHLNRLPIRIWDEARSAISAFELFKNGNFIVTTFGYEPDMWSTKPPLLIWIQAFLMKIIGVNELAVRLPSAFAGLATCFILFFFLKRYLKDFWIAFLTVLVLITSIGYFDTHSTRTGDYDALLTFFTTASGLLIFTYIETKKTKYLHLFFIAITLEVLTKSITGLLFLPAIALFIIIEKELVNLLKNKHFYIGIGYFLFFTLGYYILREQYNAGYLQAVWENDLGGRFLAPLDGHQHGFWFYFKNLLTFKYSYWYMLVPIGSILGFFHSNKKINKITLFSTLMVVVFFFVISSAQTKIEWYDLPMYPFFAILVSISLSFVFEFLKNWSWAIQNLKYNVVPFLFIFLVFISPYEKVIEKTVSPKEKEHEKVFYEITYFLRDATKGKYDLKEHLVLYDGYLAHNLFYVKVLNEQNVNISFANWKSLKQGDKVVVCQENIKQFIRENYNYTTKMEKGSVALYTILNVK